MILCHCPRCNLVFKARSFLFEGRVERITFNNSTETCPRCGARARILDGIYNITQDAITVVSAPHITRSMYQQFYQVLERAKRGEITGDELQKAAGDIAPEFAKAATLLSATSFKFVALVIFMMWLKGCTIEAKIGFDINQALDQLGWTVEETVDPKPKQATEGEMTDSPSRENDEIVVQNTADKFSILKHRKRALLLSASGFRRV